MSPRAAVGLRSPVVVLAGPWLELRNKLDVCWWVERTGRSVWRSRPALAEAVAAARRFGPFREPWVVEGVARRYAQDACHGGREPRDLLHRRVVAALPASSILMLNAGLGLALAEHLLDEAGDDPSAPVIERTIARFHALCHANVSPGHEATALQGLGFVARAWHAPAMPLIAAAVAALDPELAIYFWHAVGRALYFLPRYFAPLPRHRRRALARLARECPDARSHRQAIAGYACAAVLVNMQHPAVVERLLPEIAASGGEAAAVGAGVRCACAVRASASPAEPFLEGLLAHRPAAGELAAWETRVRRPCERGLADLPVLEREGRLGELLREVDAAASPVF